MLASSITPQPTGSALMNIMIICQWFPPEYAPIGVMLHELAEDLSSKGHALTVITGFPNYPSGVLFDRFKKSLFTEETVNGVRIIRCYLYTSPKKTVTRRILNYLTFAVTSFIAAMRLKDHDLLFMVSPPLSNGAIAILLKKWKGLRYVFNVQDLYPDAAISSRIIRNRLLIRILRKTEARIYRSADRITVISEGFKENLIGKGIPPSKISVLNNWLDTGEIAPLPRNNDFSRQQGLTGKFVVLYSGTIGLISGAELLLTCAERLAVREDILLLFVGDGIAKKGIADEARKRGLRNVKFLPLQPREVLSQVQSSSDVSVVTLRRGTGRTSVPSKVLGYMAAARPIVASVDPDSDTKKLVEQADCGICVEPEDADAVTMAILELYRDRHRAVLLGRNGRDFIVRNCDRKAMTAQYEALFQACLEG